MSKCPKCGAEVDRQLETRAFYECHSTSLESGFHQSPSCRIRELTAENERLRKEVEDYRKGAAAEAAAGDEAREELANARDFIAASPTGQQRCYKCNQWVFSYPCMYCGR